jgi:hypothetical protein
MRVKARIVWGIAATAVKLPWDLPMTTLTCTYFMLLKATSLWHALDRDEQCAVFEQALMTVFNGYPELRMSRFNAAGLHERCTDLIVWQLAEGADAAQYDAAIEALRAQPIFAAPLFEIVDVIPGVEDEAPDALPLAAFAL